MLFVSDDTFIKNNLESEAQRVVKEEQWLAEVQGKAQSKQS